MDNKVKSVGVFSLGLNLIFLGCLIMFSLIFRRSSVKIFLIFSPVFLVVLGLEILVKRYFYREENLSFNKTAIFLINSYLVFGLTFYSLMELGLVDRVFRLIDLNPYFLDNNFTYSLEDIDSVKLNLKNRSLYCSLSDQKNIGIYESATIRKEDFLKAKDYFYLHISDKSVRDREFLLRVGEHELINSFEQNLSINLGSNQAIDIEDGVGLNFDIYDLGNKLTFKDPSNLELNFYDGTTRPVEVIVLNNNLKNFKTNLDFTRTDYGKDHSLLKYGQGEAYLKIINPKSKLTINNLSLD